MDPQTALRALARLHGVQLSHVDGNRTRRRAPTGTLVAILRALGEPIERAADAPEALSARRAGADPLVGPVVVAWDGVLPAAARRGKLDLEDGSPAPPDGTLPTGYHRLEIDGGAPRLVIAAPSRAPFREGRRWGLFAPVHALRRDDDLGVGDLTSLRDLSSLVGGEGGDLVGVLPPLALFLDEPYEPSPYAAVSRLHWSEALVDPARAPELGRSEEARRRLQEAERAAGALRSLEAADLRRAMALKRPVLEALARAFFAGSVPEAFERFAGEHDVDAYARFRAACELRRTGWRGWPGAELPRALDPEAVRYHAYAQWLAEQQLADAGALLLDMPLGVHPEGYDTWRERGLFAEGMAVGAPPDAFSMEGQNWGFPPVLPDRSRAQHHRYLIASIRTMLRHASALRVDHVMGLHRLFWIPDGRPAAEGTYVASPKDELYAILTLEAQRAQAAIVGEDLGTVPPSVRAALRRHDLHRMFVTQVEIRPREEPPLRRVPSRAQASLNTHDMFPFRAWWEGGDVDRRVEVGVLPAEAVDDERSERTEARAALARHLGFDPDAGWEEALDAALAHLAGSDAALVLVALEDLWGETEPQNIPGTTDRHPNWRRRARHTVQGASMMTGVMGRLEVLATLRRKMGG